MPTSKRTQTETFSIIFAQTGKARNPPLQKMKKFTSKKHAEIKDLDIFDYK